MQNRKLATLATTLVLALVLASGVQAQTVVSSDVSTNTIWSGEIILDGVIFVNNNATLTIDAGTIVRGQPRTGLQVVGDPATAPGALVVTLDGTILANGTAVNPIIFTTAAVDNDQNGVADNSTPGDIYLDTWVAGDLFLDDTPATAPLAPLNADGESNVSLWGGLVLLGEAPTNLADTGNGRLMRVDATSLAGVVVLDGLVGPTQVLSDGAQLFIIESGENRVLRWAPGDAEAEVVASFVTPPTAMAAGEEFVVVATDDQIVWVGYAVGTQATLIDGLDGVGSVTIVDDQVWFTELGTVTLANAQVARISLSGGTPMARVDQSILQGVFRVPQLAWDALESRLVFTIVLDGWPYAGLVVRAQTTGGQLEVLTHGPPKMGPILPTAEGIVIGSERTVLRATPGGAYATLGAWSSPSAVASDAQGAVAWTDRHAGVLWLRD